MRITLVSPYPDITNYGLRTLSAVLKQAGHQVTFLCMPDFAGDGEFTHIRMSEERYPPHVIALGCLRVAMALEGADTLPWCEQNGVCKEDVKGVCAELVKRCRSL